MEKITCIACGTKEEIPSELKDLFQGSHVCDICIAETNFILEFENAETAVNEAMRAF